MKRFQTLPLALLLIALTANVSQAGKVTVKGVHLCCGACVTGAQKSLGGVKGVADVVADRNSKIVVFSATDDKAAQNGINALAKAGFHGAATHGKKKLSFPASGAKKGDKADTITLTGVHLCCGACVTGAQKALQNVKGVTAIDVDRKEKLVRLSGKEIDVVSAVAALNKGGFHGTLKKGK